MAKNKLPKSDKSVVKIQDFEESSSKNKIEELYQTKMEYVPRRKSLNKKSIMMLLLLEV